ncbi:MAG: RecX family transcriptional regulator [Anaerolineae bacterium]|nr:RecX family transcriptional regulator [Anaerolineae bacterium]
MSRTITALEVQRKNKDRVSVFLDGEFEFGLPALEAAKLRKGQVLSEAEIAVLREIDAVARAFDRAVRLLARRPYSAAEIRRNLASKSIAPPIIDEVLTRLEHMGYVDDRAFAAYWLDNRERFRPRGPRALHYELRQKGIAQDIIDAVLGEVDAEASAYRAAQGRVSRLQGKTRAEFREKLGTFLARRGFGYDIVRTVIDQLIDELSEEQPDYFATEPMNEE